jgi:hypothetical protein
VRVRIPPALPLLDVGLFVLAVRIREGRRPWTGQRGWAVLLAFDIRLEVGDNNERQGCHPSGHRGDLAKVLPLPVAAPMSGVAIMQEAITLLIVDTKRMHPWPGARGRVASTSFPCGATRGLVCLPRPPGCDPLKVEPIGMWSGSDFDNLLDYKGRTD